jgi:hypothetical protein
MEVRLIRGRRVEGYCHPSPLRRWSDDEFLAVEAFRFLAYIKGSSHRVPSGRRIRG